MLKIQSITNYHSLKKNELFDVLNTSEEGLTEEEAIYRFEKFGPNELQAGKKASKLELLLSQFTNGITYILFFAAIISLIVGKVINFSVILAVILANGLIGFLQEAKADSALTALKNMTTPESNVLRNCNQGSECIEFKLNTREIVVGDLILLESGDKVPADGRLIENSNLEVDESMLTGESLPVRKNLDTIPEGAPLADRKNLVYSGTIITSGRGRAIVFATGMNTEMGKITNLINDTEEKKSPLQIKIDKLSKMLGLIAIIMSLTIFGIGLLRGFDFIEMLLFGIASLVSSIPSGLPASITITLSVGVQRMAKRNAVIRKLTAIDSLGSVTTIVTDKTGTLTTNQMTAQKIFISDSIYNISGIGYNPEGDIFLDNNPDKLIRKESTDHEIYKLLNSAILCNDSHLVNHKKDSSQTEWEITGDPTEGALIVAGAKIQIQKENLRKLYPRIDEIPFDSKNRFMVTFHKEINGTSTNNPNIIMHMKGAPETILAFSNQILNQNKTDSLDQKKRDEIKKTNNELASQGLRILGFASLILKENEIDRIKKVIQEKAEPIENLKFLGLVGMIDPPRKEVKDAIKLCKNAGINVIMATGDHKLTAQAIGKEIGIIGHTSKIFEGIEIEDFSDEKLDLDIQSTNAFVRVSPTHKYRVVNSLRRLNKVVAMTGDGANDAPALKAADIGIAMGITGTDVTKETASMVLTDDNFASIVNAIEEGRVVSDNILKGLKFLLTTNVGEILTILLSIIFLQDQTPLFTALAILWVNLVTDGSLTVAIAKEPKESDVMSLPPKSHDEKLLSKDLLFGIFFVAIIMAVGVLLISLLHGQNASIIEKQTLAFNSLAFFQIINAINCRSRSESIFHLGLFSNRSITIGLIISITLQVMAIQAPFMNVILETTPLAWVDWIIIIFSALSLLFAEELRKYLIRKKNS